ncbi:MAG TPA: hypothetical protein PKZ70_08755, partial [Candidatus Atribacteria bacterium]|nr:hypothetical protein [Candidatus Atribacteria bacterium]
LAALLSGCSVTVTPRHGDIKICTDDSDIYGYVYIDDEYTGYCIDGAEWWEYCPNCTTGWITVTLNQRHKLEVWDSFDGTTYIGSFTPTSDGQEIWINK